MIDFHQHLWPEPFVRALFARTSPPQLVRDGGDVLLVVSHEPPSAMDLSVHELDVRLSQLDRDGVAAAVVSISSPVGVEALPADHARALLGEYHSGLADVVSEARGRLVALAAPALGEDDAGAAEVGRLIDSGFAGASLPADALADLDGLARCRPLLAELARREAVMFVHPGPAPWHATRAPAGVSRAWTSAALYTGAMLRAYFTWRAAAEAGEVMPPTVFTIMAGGAPFVEERFTSFNGAAHAVDPRVYFDTASYGPRALELALATYGAERVVLGSDVPVLDGAPVYAALDRLGDRVRDMVADTTPRRLLGRSAVVEATAVAS
jgi:6-methylsalicylate decarboxylase